MMLYEILEEISEKSNHALPDHSIIRKVDLLQKNLFRNNVDATDISTLDLEDGLSLYPLPFPPGNIKEVLVNGSPLPQGRLKGTDYSRYYYLLNGTIGVFPTPKQDVIEGLRIFHKRIPRTLTTGDMEAEPDLDSDYHLLLVYEVLKDIADSSKVSEYKEKYDEQLGLFITANQEPEYPTIREVYSL